MILPDVLQEDLKVVFCGTAPGIMSAQKRAYYAGRGNRFWNTLFVVGLTPRQLAPAEYHSAPNYGIGLTDLSKQAFGNDDSLSQKDFSVSDLKQKIHMFKPRILAFTSKKAAKIFLGNDTDYGLQTVLQETTRLFVLPSPSGAARKYWDLSIWWDLSQLSRSHRCGA